MYDLILNVAKNDERIRAVYLNGSRTNPNVPKDIFQDFDVVYLVNETETFIKNKNWIKIFGDILILQLPDELDKIAEHRTNFNHCYGYLMQFSDGNRIDLHIQTIDLAIEEYKKDKLTITILDKDNVLPKITSPTDIDYWVKKPTQDLFYRCCNEFWWITLYVAKGLWRNEILFAMDFLNLSEYGVRAQLIQMLSWYVGIQTDFSLSVGKCGKYLDKYLYKDIWERLLETYPNGNIEAIWKSTFIMCELFEEIALEVSEKLELKYPTNEAQKCLAYAKHISQLPKDALQIV